MPSSFRLVLLSGLLLAAPAAVAQAPPEAFALEARLLASAPEPDAGFGRTLAASACPDGSVLALTADYSTASPGAVGTAYVLRRSAEGAWAEEARLPDPSAAGAYTGFGSSAAVLCRSDGSALALVGDPSHTPAALPPNSGGGAVYAYRRAPEARGGAWALEDTLVGAAPEPFVQFGFALGLAALPDGSALALVSAPGREYPTTFGGRVYAYARAAAGAPADTAWALAGALAGALWFGLNVELVRDPTVMGGATAFVQSYSSPDSAYAVTAFERLGPGDWHRAGELMDPTGDPWSSFGNGLALDVLPEGEPGGLTVRALVGAPGVASPDGIFQAGAAYVFERAGPDAGAAGAWALADSLRAPDPTLSAVFGFSVALLDSVALVGARGTDTAAGDNAGAAYHFRLDADAAGSSGTGGGSGAWSLVERLEAPAGGYLDGYGHAVALAPLPEGEPEGDGAVLGLVAAFAESSALGLNHGALYAYTAEGRPVAAEPGAPVAQAAPLALTAFPNPARGAATLRLRLGAPSEVTVTVFDGLGRRVRTLPAGPLPAGAHALGLDLSGLAPGLYLARAAAGPHTTTATLTILP